jgi:hypothetical protein
MSSAYHHGHACQRLAVCQTLCCAEVAGLAFFLVESITNCCCLMRVNGTVTSCELQEDHLDLYCAPKFVERERTAGDRDRDRDRDNRNETSTFLRIDIKALST